MSPLKFSVFYFLPNCNIREFNPFSTNFNIISFSNHYFYNKCYIEIKKIEMKYSKRVTAEVLTR